MESYTNEFGRLRYEGDDKAKKDLAAVVDIALVHYNLDTCLDGDELPLNDEITLDTPDKDGNNLVAYAISREYVVVTKGDTVFGGKVVFDALDRDDIYTLIDIVGDEYDIDCD